MSAALILAAGASRRFGGIKQLARLGAEPLVVRACKSALGADCHPVVLVLGSSYDQVREATRELPIVSLFNPQWRQGMSASIRHGVEYLTPNSASKDLCIILGDQPLIDSEHLRRLRERRRQLEAPLAATDHGGLLGPPAVFARRLWRKLRVLRHDRGAAELLAKTKTGHIHTKP